MSAFETNHTLPNILITGTPGTGKSSLAQLASEKLAPKGFKYIDVTALIRDHECHEGMDEEFNSLIVDDDKLLDVMEELLTNGGCIVDYHSCDFFPERWFELVLVMTTKTELLYDRLIARGYDTKKVNENMECEIMKVVLDSAKESYAEEVVQELPSNSTEEMESNMARIEGWVDHWIANNKNSHKTDYI
jgi:adenylate kinase